MFETLLLVPVQTTRNFVNKFQHEEIEDFNSSTSFLPKIRIN